MIKVMGLNQIEKMANAENKIRELNKQHYERVVAQYMANGVDKDLAKVMAKTMIEYKLA